jgi:beta-galactosidase
MERDGDACFLFALRISLLSAQHAAGGRRGNGFLLRGKPFQILSGELEYARIPRADWRDRLA